MKQTGTDRDPTDKHLKGKFGGQLALNCAARCGGENDLLPATYTERRNDHGALGASKIFQAKFAPLCETSPLEFLSC